MILRKKMVYTRNEFFSTKVSLILTIILCLNLSSPLLADCIASDMQKMKETSKHIFIGELVNLTSTTSARFTIRKSWKGQANGEVNLKISKPRAVKNGYSFSFTTKEDYLIFSDSTGQLIIADCDESGPIKYSGVTINTMEYGDETNWPIKVLKDGLRSKESDLRFASLNTIKRRKIYDQETENLVRILAHSNSFDIDASLAREYLAKNIDRHQDFNLLYPFIITKNAKGKDFPDYNICDHLNKIESLKPWKIKVIEQLRKDLLVETKPDRIEALKVALSLLLSQ